MTKGFRCLTVIWIVLACARGSVPAQTSPPSASSTQPVRPIGVVTEIRPGSFKLHTDAGPELLINLPDGVTVARVPPGAKDLKSATKIGVSDISSGDRVLVRGHFSDDQKSVAATSVIVMSKADLASAAAAERLDWQRRGIGGPVKAVNPATKEITISVPNMPPTPGSPTHPMTITTGTSATLLRYAPDSVKFSDAKPSRFEEIKPGDQVRALGTKSEDGTRFTAEKLVSGTFRNIGATVDSVDAAAGTVSVKDLATGKNLLVRTNADSRMHRLPPFVAMMIARLNSGAGANPGGNASGGGSAGSPSGNALTAQGQPGGRPPEPGRGGVGGGYSGGFGGGRAPSGPGGGFGGGPRDINQLLDRTPPLKLDELKAGDALIVVSTEGASPAQVTAIVLLAGVEPILAAQPKGSSQMILGQWNMGIGGGEQGGGGEGGP